MEEKIQKWLYDIQFAIEEIESFLSKYPTISNSIQAI